MIKNIYNTCFIYALFVLFTLCSCGKAIDSSDLDSLNTSDFQTDYLGKGVYGIRWRINDPLDSGERCFDSVGKRAVIGYGDTDGFSDFDRIYPWSEIKRCNIMYQGADGEEQIIYEGESGFSLDGSNGDVFVRIPRFCVERYEKDGYEYRTISKQGEKVHPVFLERDRVLDAIYIAAFEGWYDYDEKILYSKGGVIPSSNISGKDFLLSAQAKGLNYTLYDNRAVDALFTLIAIEFGCRNTNHFLGYGYADYIQPVDNVSNMIVEAKKKTNSVKIPYLDNSRRPHLPVGSNITICKGNQSTVIAQRTITAISHSWLDKYSVISFSGEPIDVDETCFIGSAACTTNFCEICGGRGRLNWHTGRADFIHNSITQNPIRYRWIENLWGSLWHFLPDVSFSDGNMYLCNDMRSYNICQITYPYILTASDLPINVDNGEKKDGAGFNFWVTNLLGDDMGVSIAKSFSNSLTSKDAFGAYYYLSNSTVCIVNGGGFDHLWRCNILTNRAWVKLSTAWYLYGARLMYKPLS